MTGNNLSKLAAIGALMVAFAVFAFGSTTRSAAAAPAGPITVTAYATCGGAITATAFVREPNGLPSAGYPVTFTSSTGGAGYGVTNGNGVATAVLSMPATWTGGMVVNATSGAAFGSTTVGVNCAPTACGYNINCNPGCPVYGCVAPLNYNCAPYAGIPYIGAPYYANNYYNNCAPVVTNTCLYYSCVAPIAAYTPAKINAAVNPGVIACGGAASVAINVTDGWGVPVNTSVSLTTSLGSITPTVSTSAGNAVATLNTAPGTSGIALITIRAGGVSTTANATVTCNQPAQQNLVIYQPAPAQTAQTVVITRPAPAQPQQPRPQVIPQQQPPRTPPFAAPRTGDAGLLDQYFENDGAANASLMDAYQHLEDAVVDDSAVDSNADIDTDVAVEASNVAGDTTVADFDARLVDENMLGDTDANASLALNLAASDHGSADFGIS